MSVITGVLLVFIMHLGKGNYILLYRLRCLKGKMVKETTIRVSMAQWGYVSELLSIICKFKPHQKGSLSKKLYPHFLTLVGSRNGIYIRKNCLFHTRTK